MTVRAILDTKGHQIQSVPPEEKLSAAIKILGERKIGAVLVMSGGRIEGILSERDIVRVLGERGAAVLEEPVRAVMTRKVDERKVRRLRHRPQLLDGRGAVGGAGEVKLRREDESEALADERIVVDDEQARLHGSDSMLRRL